MDVIATNIHSDAPIQGVSEDKFGRGALVELLAKSIQEKCKSDHDSICIGIYGKWGEGKTSFVNMLKSHPVITDSDGICIADFNPWVINDANGLIKEFFKVIAGNADKKLKKFIARYGGIIIYSSQIVGNLVVPGLGNLLKSHLKELETYIHKSGDISIEYQKKQISSELIKSNKHLVVFIDDIDRLDCDEMHSVFRLVRQVADFKNTIYILSLDEDRVSKSLGKYYGQGGEDDGRQFLEKIVQVPIVLPQIQSTTIKFLLREHLFELFESCGLTAVAEVAEIVDKLAPLFETNREIVRYINQLQFFFPIVHTEVNHCDYCILEAIKTLNPKAYNLIKSKPWVIQKEMPASYRPKSNENDFNIVIENSYYEFVEQISDLFPLSRQEAIKTIMTYYLSGDLNNTDATAKDKRLFSGIYFDRYFLQTTPNNFIADQSADNVNYNDVIDIQRWIKQMGVYGDGEIARALFDMADRHNLAEHHRTNIYIALCTSTITERDSFVSIADHIVEMFLPSLSDENFKKVITAIFTRVDVARCVQFFGIMDQKSRTRVGRDQLLALKERLREISFLILFQFPRFVYEPFLSKWKEYDRSDFVEGMEATFCHQQFDTNKFIDDYLTSEDDSILLNEMFDIVRMFGKTLHILLFEKTDAFVSQKCKILAHNYSYIMEQLRGI